LRKQSAVVSGVRRAQKHLRLIDPSRHGKLIQQIQARLLAAQGRGGDTEVAHVTPGELVLPPDLQTPELMALLQDAADARGINVARLFVGSARNSINPRTRTREFKAPDPNNPDPTIETFTVTAPAPSNAIEYGTFLPTISTPDPGFGIGGEPWLVNENPAVATQPQPDPGIEEIVVTAPPPKLLDRLREWFEKTPRFYQAEWDRFKEIHANPAGYSDDDLAWANAWVQASTLGIGTLSGALTVGIDSLTSRKIPRNLRVGVGGLVGTVTGLPLYIKYAPGINREIQKRMNENRWSPTPEAPPSV